MAQHAPLIGEAWPEDTGPRASLRACELPDPVRVQRDELFRDADQHGPRWPVLARRALPAFTVLPLALALAAWQPWRGVVIDLASPRIADLLLVAPIVVALVMLAAATAPLARVRVEPILGAGFLLLGSSLWLARDGELVAATVPGAVAAILIGLAAARAVRRAVWLLPVLLAAGLSDAQSVQSGITERLLLDAGAPGREQVVPVVSVAPELVARVDLLVLHVPAATGTWMLGLVDVLALGMLLGLAHLYWLAVGRTAVALGAALLLAVAVAAPLPVLPLLGLAWVLVHARLVWRATRFSLRRLTYLGG